MGVQDSLTDHLRAALRGFAQGVVIITTRGLEPQAMSATAVAPVAFDPPSLLVCVNRASSIHPTLAAGRPYYVNMLGSRHVELAQKCAGAARGIDRFRFGDWDEDPDGTPYLCDAQAAIRCEASEHLAHGTHGVFIGQVVRVRAGAEIDPLIYLNGDYRSSGASLPSPAALA
jgi:flavin reductase (DIM6/NTAB) family NADH-FMN oxidoreductase RutF